jgi:hypothetical protein
MAKNKTEKQPKPEAASIRKGTLRTKWKYAQAEGSKLSFRAWCRENATQLLEYYLEKFEGSLTVSRPAAKLIGDA